MDRQTTVFERLLAYWKEQGLDARRPCTPSEIEAFEERESVKLPEDFRTYWRFADGMRGEIGQYSDKEGFSFWPLHRVTRADIELGRHSPPSPLPIDSMDSYVFADYLDWSWAYAITLRSADIGKVILVGGNVVSVVASSFSAFIEVYLCDGPTLYPEN